MNKIIYPQYKNVPVKGRLGFCLKVLNENSLAHMSVLDFGCSYGWLADRLKERGLKKYVGVDPNMSAVRHAQKMNKYAQFYVSGAEVLPDKIKEKFDVVTIFDVIEHVPVGREMSTFKEASRMLKKGGRLLITTPNYHWLTNLTDPAWYLGHRHYQENKMIKMVKKVGFEIQEVGVKGGIWSIIYMNWFYIKKWIFGDNSPRNKWLEEKEDEGYKGNGIFTLYLVAKKN
ncbi:hypothetical protein A2382_00645 [Candidatus Woesebacteria bacterium RIFOXYB1_FULL_38_16]|uniref:Methyltransferase type 11 domain-containing protein n=1 Tax=Candidatus Woesebacteria bacterium RIFOXYB1_FULL_38_16 TaxID=1802538 RepID=A0A1F8CU59_9BACT|nr:MAG: hypothetical protein A2382_00645 [Candidatus Woesebacteria bacterium RIFOXYB1_FULL_38_16]